ncbi:hypothetical protein [Raineyella antarctica]|nr:hypothetical protein [Raineyella antarctica]
MSDKHWGRAAGRLGLAAGAALVALVAVTVPAVAAPDQRAAVIKVNFAGYVSMASWSTCPDLSVQEPGTVCTGAAVMVFYSSGSEQAGSEVHLHDRKNGVVKTYDSTCVVADVEVDPGVVERTCLLQSERFGRATEADVTVDPRLVATEAVATVPVQLTDWVNDTGTTGTLHVAADFSGTGPIRRIDERTHWADRYVMWLEGTRGWERNCTARATFDGTAVPGELVSCSMSRVRQGEMRVYHNTPA